MRGMFIMAVVAGVLLSSSEGVGLSVPKGATDAVLDTLRRDLLLAQRLLAASAVKGPNHSFYPLQCTCEDYCGARCFSIGCVPCTPSAFSFPGGESLCLSPGPLGGGLLCQPDGQTPCCTQTGPTCWLPSACDDCSQYPPPPTGLFPPLNRRFIINTCM